VLAALVLAAFVNSLGAGLIFDNRAIVLEDPRLRAFTLEHLSQIVTRITGGRTRKPRSTGLSPPSPTCSTTRFSAMQTALPDTTSSISCFTA